METSNSDLYTIPSYSSWFSWSSIHEIERISLPEFFDGSSITRSPRIYKEYRDFIISKYREDPSRSRLTFTGVRKSLVGDVNSLQKVFTFLDKWGLINFTENASSVAGDAEKQYDWIIRVEEGAPHGVRVVAAPNSLKPVTAPAPPPLEIGGGAEVAEIGTKFPPLASYSNLFEELIVQKQGKKCASCKENCDSGYYELIKHQDEEYTLCKKCFDNSSYGESKSINDFKLVDHKNQEVVWTQAETLLLLESVLKHGDDWDLVTENVKTKTKLDCIHKLLQLPFGDFLLGSSFMKNRDSDTNGDVSSVKEVQISSSESQETACRQDDDKNQDKKIEIADHDDKKNQDEKMENAGTDDKKNSDEEMENAGTDDKKNPDEEMENASTEDKKNPNEEMYNSDTDNKKHDDDDDEMEDAGHDDKIQTEKTKNADNDEKMVNAEEKGPSRKRRFTEPVYDASSSLMNQVARLSSVVGPHVTASAAEAAIAQLCYENGCTSELFYDDNIAADEETEASSPLTNEQKIITEAESADGLQGSMVSEHQDTTVERNVVSLTLKMRAATATALGAASAHAKLLANQEEREIEHLFATVLEIQLKKLHSKVKHLESMELILMKQHNEIEEFKRCMVTERINVLREIFSRGLSRSNDLPSLLSQSSNSV